MPSQPILVTGAASECRQLFVFGGQLTFGIGQLARQPVLVPGGIPERCQFPVALAELLFEFVRSRFALVEVGGRGGTQARQLCFEVGLLPLEVGDP